MMMILDLLLGWKKIRKHIPQMLVKHGDFHPMGSNPVKSHPKKNKHKCFWLVVEPTPLKNMLVKMGSSSPRIGVKIKHI